MSIIVGGVNEQYSIVNNNVCASDKTTEMSTIASNGTGVSFTIAIVQV